MSFYSILSRYYDEIFPPSAEQCIFIQNLLSRRPSKILDAGCGAGGLSSLLASEGNIVTGIDSDPGMIRAATARYAKNPSLSFVLRDMSKQGQISGEPFDAVVSFGNALVHMKEDAAKKFIFSAGEKLSAGGDLFIQILNYDRLAAAGEKNLPVIETQNIIFKRYYDWNDGLVFTARLFEKASGTESENSIRLYPVTKSDLSEMISCGNFSEAKFFGTFGMKDWDCGDFMTIVHARKNR